MHPGMCVSLWAHTFMTWAYYVFLQKRKLRHTETKQLDPSHAAGILQRQDSPLNSELLPYHLASPCRLLRDQWTQEASLCRSELCPCRPRDGAILFHVWVTLARSGKAQRPLSSPQSHQKSSPCQAPSPGPPNWTPHLTSQLAWSQEGALLHNII